MRHIPLILTTSLFVLFSCSQMNEIHDEFLEGGERTYIGKVDSLKIFPGNERVKLRFWISDPRAKAVKFFWVPDDDSIQYELTRISPRDSFELEIGGTGNTKTIKEGSYTMKMVTSDHNGHHSLPVNTTLNVYGEKYKNSLINRNLNMSQYDSDKETLQVAFSGAFNDQDIGIEVRYTEKSGKGITRLIPPSESGTASLLTNIDVSKGASFRTAYLPVPTAIDTFYSVSDPIEIVALVNIALNKMVRTSGNNSADNAGEKAVDGIMTNESRWVSPASGEHWLEIDLGEEFSVTGFKTWTGTNGNLGYPTKNFIFQAEINGEWTNVTVVENNANPAFEATFEVVKTSRVRYYIPAYDGNRVRLYEIAVFSTIKY